MANPKTSQADVVDTVANTTGESRSTVQEIVSSFQDAITEELKKGNDVSLSLGTFKRADRDAGVARNPQTGEQIKTKAKRGARFKVGTRLKNALN